MDPMRCVCLSGVQWPDVQLWDRQCGERLGKTSIVDYERSVRASYLPTFVRDPNVQRFGLWEVAFERVSERLYARRLSW